jgi:selenophosphate synthetase-related protein
MERFYLPRQLSQSSRCISIYISRPDDRSAEADCLPRLARGDQDRLEMSIVGGKFDRDLLACIETRAMNALIVPNAVVLPMHAIIGGRRLRRRWPRLLYYI